MRRPGWIQCASGQPFWPLDPKPEDVRLEDIAHALAHVGRFTGHAKRFYSVAEHSVRVARRVWDLSRRVGAADLGECPPVCRECKRLALWGLLHDASEAYLADVASPVKRMPEFAAYRAAEHRLQTVIVEAFGLPPDEPDLVKRADLELLGAEAEALLDVSPEWRAAAPAGTFPVPHELQRGAEWFGWDPGHANDAFLTAFARYSR